MADRAGDKPARLGDPSPVVSVGTSFIWVIPDNDHLCFVVTLPSDGEVAVFWLSTLRDYNVDKTCLVCVGDHPFVKHDSMILYRHSRMVTTGQIASLYKSGRARPKESASDILMLRIREGALASQFTPGEVKEAVRLCGWRPTAKGADPGS